MAENEQSILIGEIISTFGRKGEVKIYPHTDYPERLAAKGDVCVKKSDTDSRVLKITKSSIHKGVVIAKFAGIDDMNAAEDLRGAKIYVSESELTKLRKDEFYIHDIIGLQVVTTEGRDLGTVKEVLRSPANDVYVTDIAMIPAVKEFVVSIDLEEKKIVVKPVEGLVQE
ncbi:MAG: ribosome maturation factor RimM [Armatimonadota bacterium]